MANEARMLTIKLGAVTRLRKELVLYKEEEKREQDKVHKLKVDQADPYDIKYAESILSESSAMVPDTQQRLKSALKDLQEFMDENESTLSDTPDFVKARDEAAAAAAAVA